MDRRCTGFSVMIVAILYVVPNKSEYNFTTALLVFPAYVIHTNVENR